MSPTALYFVLVLGAVFICTAALIVWRPAHRACLGCEEQTPIGAARCRHCGYVATA